MEKKPDKWSQKLNFKKIQGSGFMINASSIISYQTDLPNNAWIERELRYSKINDSKIDAISWKHLLISQIVTNLKCFFI